MLKEELWTRRTTAEIMILKRNKTIGNLDLLEEIQRNNTKKHKVEQELEKKDGLAWEQNRIIYIDGWIYISKLKK